MICINEATRVSVTHLVDNHVCWRAAGRWQGCLDRVAAIVAHLRHDPSKAGSFLVGRPSYLDDIAKPFVEPAKPRATPSSHQ